MTINNLHKILGKLISKGLGRMEVCVDKTKVNHVLEDDGAVIIPVTAATVTSHEMINDDGGRKELANGQVAERTALVIQAELGTPSRDERLRCSVLGNRLIISIGIDTLKFCAENQDGNPRLEIKDAQILAEDVRIQLLEEDEVGASPLTDLFDKAVLASCENGSTAFDYSKPIPIR